MGLKNSGSNTTACINRHIGTAYDKVAIVADNIDEVKALGSVLASSFKYLGASDVPPSVRLDGSVIQNGDYYFDSVNDSLAYYDLDSNGWFVVDPAQVEANVVAAALSESNAAVSESNASTSASLASTKAAESSLSASEAATSAGIATAKAVEAANSAIAAQSVISTVQDALDGYAGFDAELFAQAGVVPNGQPDTLGNSQRVEAINRVSVRKNFDLYRRSYAEAGYNLVAGSFEAGGTLVNTNDVLLQERTGKAFSGPAGAVAAGTNPASGGFVDVSNAQNVEIESVAEMLASDWLQLLPDGTVITTRRYNDAVMSHWEKFGSNPGSGFVLSGAGCFFLLTSTDNDARHYGVNFADSVADQHQALQSYASHAREFNIPSDVELFTNDEILVPHANVDISGRINAKGATGAFAKGAVVTIGQYAAVQTTTILAAATKGLEFLDVVSTTDLRVGDIITIYDPTDFSFAPQRAYYRAGEHLKISEIVSPTRIRCTNTLFDNYAAGVAVYKLNPTKCNIKNLNVHLGTECAYAVTLESIAEGVVLSSACSGGSIATIHRNRCYDVTFLNPSNVQWFNDGSTTNYAHYTLASQKVVDLNPNVRAFRHALTLTARDQELSVPCRQCGAIGGSAASFTSQSGVTAVDFHGSTEACFYDDMDVYGGANIGGKNNRVRSRIRQVLQPSCIRAGELVNTNHDYSGCAIFTSKADSQGYAQWIDIGGITNNITASTQAGGLLDFSNLVIDTSAGNPAEVSKTVEIKNRGYGGSDLKVSFRGAKRVGATSQSNWQRIYVGDIVSGVPFGEIDMRDCDLDGIATRLKANTVLADGYKSIGSSIMAQLSVGLEVFICDGRALLGDVHVEDCNLSPVNVRGETAVAGIKRAYIGNLKAINGNKALGSTTEENSGVALRDLDFAQYNDVITLGLAVNAGAANALRANAVTTLVVGSRHAQGYANNALSLAGGTVAVNMKFGNVP